MSSNQYDANIGELKPFSGTPINEITSINAKIAKESDRYSDQATYEVGDLCIYDNKLYKCTEAVTTAGSWETNSSKFERESLTHYSNSLKDALSNYTVNSKLQDITTNSYQATQNCLIYVRAGSNNGASISASINDLPVYFCYNSGQQQAQTSSIIPLKKGQTITFSGTFIARAVYSA